MEKERAQLIVDKFLKEVGEYVDSAQVFLTFHDGDSTASFEKGMGNFFARHGQVSEWLIMQREFQKNYAKKKDSQE